MCVCVVRSTPEQKLLQTVAHTDIISSWTVMSELLFRHRERKDCLLVNPCWDLKWYCRQKVCREAGAGKNNKKNQLFHHLNVAAAARSPTPTPHLRSSRKKTAEQRSNFKCNSATTPINLNFIPRRLNRVRPAGRGGPRGGITWKSKMLCWLALLNMNLKTQRALFNQVCCCLWWLFHVFFF